jgi:signal transduction histidine kinase
MDLYVRKNRRKLFLLIMGAIIAVISILYSNYITERLAQEEKKKVELWAEAMKRLTSENAESQDIEFIFKVIENYETIPVIVTDEEGKMVFYRNVDSSIVADSVKLKKEIMEMEASHEPIEILVTSDIKQYVFYKDSILLQQLKIFPFIQLFLIVVFIGLSYYAFSTTRRAEQNLVWVGMSKETAHQLGTPIFSLKGWVELLKTDENVNPEIAKELEKDVNKLELIAERFSKVGSAPELRKKDVVRIINKTIDYLRPRTSKKIKFELLVEKDRIDANVNEMLFSWVLENIMKNSIDAMPNGGEIKITVFNHKGKVVIDVKDTGIGIPKNKHKAVFKPGFSSKKRGWGLGLSLSKRIIEEYHKGKIFVKSSEPGKGTVIRIIL